MPALTEGDDGRVRMFRGEIEIRGDRRRYGLPFAPAAAAAGNEIFTESGWVQISFPSINCRRFMVTLSCRWSTSTSR